MAEMKITPQFLPEPGFSEDDSDREGVAFGVAKFSSGLMEDVGVSAFRYRDPEVREALVGVIQTHGLAPEIRWDRGGGMFVFNLYF